MRSLYRVGPSERCCGLIDQRKSLPAAVAVDDDGGDGDAWMKNENFAKDYCDDLIPQQQARMTTHLSLRTSCWHFLWNLFRLLLPQLHRMRHVAVSWTAASGLSARQFSPASTESSFATHWDGTVTSTLLVRRRPRKLHIRRAPN